MSDQEASKMLRTYNIAWWGNNYYDVNELGISASAQIRMFRKPVSIWRNWLKSARPKASVCQPCSASRRSCSTVCVRLTPRLNARGNLTAISGDYFLVYPIKVNQHKRVIESLINSGEPLGLEAGSKAELMAVLAHAGHDPLGDCL